MTEKLYREQVQVDLINSELRVVAKAAFDLETENKALRALLVELEWSGCGETSCPICDARFAHATGCKLAEALAK